MIAGALVGGYFAARNNGPAGATRVTHQSDGALELAGTDPVTGRHVDLASYRGKPLVINVWGSWCPGCNAEAADLARFARSHADVQVVGVDTQDSSSAAKSFYRKWGWRHANQYGNVYGSGRSDLPASLPRIALPLDPSQVEPAPREYVA